MIFIATLNRIVIQISIQSHEKSHALDGFGCCLSYGSVVIVYQKNIFWFEDWCVLDEDRARLEQIVRSVEIDSNIGFQELTSDAAQ